ncbi:MAG: response regulator [Sandaracinaceae bacterium]
MSRPLEILLVEDDPADADLARLGLRRARVKNRVHVVNTAEHAALFLDRSRPYGRAPRPDLVFLDLVLPGAPGVTVLERIRGMPQIGTIPVVVLTGTATPSLVADLYGKGASCVLKKPVELALLLEASAVLDGFFAALGSASSLPPIEPQLTG